MANTSPSAVETCLFYELVCKSKCGHKHAHGQAVQLAMQLEGKVIRLDDEFLGNKNISYHDLVNVMVEKPDRFLVSDLLRNASTQVIHAVMSLLLREVTQSRYNKGR